MPESYSRALLQPYVSDHTRIEFGRIYQTFPYSPILNQERTVDLADLLFAVTIMTPILEEINEQDGGRLNTAKGLALGRNKMVSIILFWDTRCGMALAHMPLTLVDALSHMASRLEIKTDRTKRVKERPPGPAPSAPRYAFDTRHCDAYPQRT